MHVVSISMYSDRILHQNEKNPKRAKRVSAGRIKRNNTV